MEGWSPGPRRHPIPPRHAPVPRPRKGLACCERAGNWENADPPGVPEAPFCTGLVDTSPHPKSWGWRKGSQAHFADENTEEGPRDLPYSETGGTGMNHVGLSDFKFSAIPRTGGFSGCSRKAPGRLGGVRVSCAGGHSVCLVYGCGIRFCLCRCPSALSALKGRGSVRL